MTTLVTGATGFVGRHVVEDALARGESVRALVRHPEQAAQLQKQGLEVVVGDIRDVGLLPAAVRGADVVVHCAAAVGAHYSRADIYATNLDGVRNLLEAMRQAGRGRVVLLSSINVLGTRNLEAATEDLPCRPSNDPAADVKIEAERLAEAYGRQGLDVTILRPGFIYGPRDTRNLPKLIDALRRGRFRYIVSRDNVVPLVHVRDVVQALRLAARVPAARGRVYHITDGSRTTIGQLVDFLAQELGSPPPQRVLRFGVARTACVLFEWLGRLRRRPAPITRAALRFLGTSRFVDIGRARAELGYQPEVLYREGVPSTLQWLKEQAHGHADIAGSPA
jgi:nucleoside-diphosphate-sugar epimerase